jgi:hypothetical protein
MQRETLQSTLSWLDFSEDDRRRMMEVVTLFNVRETRDELGLGSIRNIFAELLFPGTGTMQTRARYFLIVPWIYQRIEKSRVPSSKIWDRLKWEETQVIGILLQGDTDGVIGRVSGANLTRFPSNIYWYGLRRWNIFRHRINQSQYHRMLDRYYLLRSSRQITDDGEPVDWGIDQNWDPHLPLPPEGFPEGLTLQLKREEAAYLREKIRLHCAESMLPHLIDAGKPLNEVPFAWLHPSLASFPEKLQKTLIHARNFSEIMFGAALQYNFMLAELDQREELHEQYRKDLDQWRELLSERNKAFTTWNLDEFWSLVYDYGRVPILSQQFVNGWIDLVMTMKSDRSIESDEGARKLVREREIYLKRGRSRFHSQRHREIWSGSAGSYQLDFRWWVARRISNDIILRLGGT